MFLVYKNDIYIIKIEEFLSKVTVRKYSTEAGDYHKTEQLQTIRNRSGAHSLRASSYSSISGRFSRSVPRCLFSALRGELLGRQRSFSSLLICRFALRNQREEPRGFFMGDSGMINWYLFSVETHILVEFRSTVSCTLSLLF